MQEVLVHSQASAGQVVIIDDEDLLLSSISRLLRRASFSVRGFASAGAALDHLRGAEGQVDVILTDLHLPAVSGMDVLRETKERWPAVPVIMMTGRASILSAVEAMKLGAYDFLVKPFDPVDALVSTVRRAVDYKRLLDRNRFLERQVQLSGRFEEMVGASEPMRRVYTMVESVAPTDATVLLLGESGTGKELVASAIHRRSSRRVRPFVVINCAALTESIIDSELFGHVAGAFTGATAGRRGLFEEASEGTIFLDEVGELPPGTQVRLLRAIQQGEIRPVGSNDVRRVHVRVIAATNRDLLRAVGEGRFREDLYFRLNVVCIELPPLRDRRDDFPALVRHFIDKHSSKLGKRVSSIAPSALVRLSAYPWPGNVRELENAVERAIILTTTETIDPSVLPPSIAHPDESPREPTRFEPRPLRDVERDHIVRTLEKTGWRVQGAGGAATLLGMKPTTLRSRMQKLGIRRTN